MQVSSKFIGGLFVAAFALFMLYGFTYLLISLGVL